MAGHSQYSNRKHRIAAQAQKKNKVYLQFRKLILKALKEKSESNLRNAIYNAQKSSISKEKIDTLLKSGEKDKTNYEDIIYEGFGPHGIAFVMHISTDNRNRTAGEIRNIFTKKNCSLGESGSVSFLFNKKGMIKYETIDSEMKDKILDQVINIDNIEDIEIEDIGENIILYCQVKDMHKLSELLYPHIGEYKEMRISWKAKEEIKINDIEQKDQVLNFIDCLLENEDIMYLDTNYQSL